MEHINSRIAQRIAYELTNQDRSRRWLSENTGIPLTTLTRKLRGLRPFNVVELYEVSSALHLDLADLISSPKVKQAA